MNKAELIDLMASLTKLSKADCKKCLEAFIEAVYRTLKKGKSLTITNFGTFLVISRKARTGVNPSTGKKMQIPGKRVPKFRAGKKLRGLV